MMSEPNEMKNGVDITVIRPLILEWQTSEQYIIVGVVAIPIVIPIRARPIISSIKKVDVSVRLENPIKSHETVAMRFKKIKVFRRPIFSER